MVSSLNELSKKITDSLGVFKHNTDFPSVYKEERGGIDRSEREMRDEDEDEIRKEKKAKISSPDISQYLIDIYYSNPHPVSSTLLTNHTRFEIHFNEIVHLLELISFLPQRLLFGPQQQIVE